MKASAYFIFSMSFAFRYSELAYAENFGPNLNSQTPSIGRLFLTPNEREYLNNTRSSAGTAPLEITALPSTPEDIPIVDDDSKKGFLLSGVLFRADGKTVIWINGKSELSEDKPSINIIDAEADRNAMEIPLQQGNQEILMKPGQVWLPTQGKAVESYNVNNNTPVNKGPAP